MPGVSLRCYVVATLPLGQDASDEVNPWNRACAALAVSLTLGACGPPSRDEPADAIDPDGSGLPIAVLARMDSAAEAFTAGDAAAAQRLYRGVTDALPDLAAAWFGLYLAERALGNTAAADTALARAKRAARAD